MSEEQLLAEELLDPISSEQPCGVDLRWTPEWDRIKEARRSDDDLDPGRWEKKERKSANWRLVQEFTSSALKSRSKDLQIAMWLTEAELKLEGFRGLSRGFHLLTELMVRYWDKGLYPPMEQGPEDRAGPLQWLNDKLVDSIVAVPITRRSDQGDDYSLLHLRDSVGLSEASFTAADGEIDEQKKRAYNAAIAKGRVSLEMFQAAVKATPFAAYDELWQEFEQVAKEFAGLEKVVDKKFGENAAPNLSACRALLAELKQEISSRLEKKRPSSAAARVDGSVNTANDGSMTLRLSLGYARTSVRGQMIMAGSRANDSLGQRGCGLTRHDPVGGERNQRQKPVSTQIAVGGNLHGQQAQPPGARHSGGTGGTDRGVQAHRMGIVRLGGQRLDAAVPVVQRRRRQSRPR